MAVLVILQPKSTTYYWYCNNPDRIISNVYILIYTWNKNGGNTNPGCYIIYHVICDVMCKNYV